MYPAGKAAIFQHLVTPGFRQGDYNVGKLSADIGSLCSDGRPPDLKSSSNECGKEEMAMILTQVNLELTN